MMASGWSFKPDAVQDLDDFLDVVAVNFLDAPAKRLEPVAIHVNVMTERRGFALAEAVRVHDGDQIIQFVISGERRRFPDRALGDFAVAEQDVGVVIQIIQPRGARHADADAETLAERAGRHVHEREARRGMAFEFAVQLPERE